MIFWVLMAIPGAVWTLLVGSAPETRHTTILLKKAQPLHWQMGKKGLDSGGLKCGHSCQWQ